MLGFRGEQGYQALSRTLLWCLFPFVSHLYYGQSKADTCRVHPTLDVLCTAGRDASVRVWDMRTRANIFTLTGHTSTVADVKTQASDPQIISSSMDSTVRYAFSCLSDPR